MLFLFGFFFLFLSLCVSAPHHFGQNHPLGVLGSLTALNMGVPGLQGLQGLHGLQHGDVLEKLKMQVRDMKVGLMVFSSSYSLSLIWLTLSLLIAY